MVDDDYEDDWLTYCELRYCVHFPVAVSDGAHYA